MAVHKFGNGLVRPPQEIPNPAMEAAMAGLKNQQVGTVPNADPFGAAVKQRSMDNTLQAVQNIPFGSDPLGLSRNAATQSYVNSAGDPQGFNTMMQAIAEQAPGGIRTPSGRGNPMPGLPASRFAAPSTMWQGGQTSAVTNKAFDPMQAFKGLQGAR